MTLALSQDQRNLFVMRGRDTDSDYITVVDTGFDPDSGRLRPPHVARTIPIDTPGPGSHNRTYAVGNRDALLLEGTAEMLVMDPADFNGFASVPARLIKLAGPDHYFYLAEAETLYIGHLRRGFVQVIDRDSGEEITRISGCPLLHGEGKDEASGRLFFACRADVIAIGTRGAERNQIVARIPYPEDQRIGMFFEGHGRVLWGYTEGILPIIYRLDPAAEPYEFTVVPLDFSIRQASARDGELFLSLTRGGVLQIRDGDSGAVVHATRVSAPFEDDYHEHVDKAILPDIRALGDNAYVSLPHEGRVAVVNLDSGEVSRYLETGGSPTRIVLVDAQMAGADMLAAGAADAGGAQRSPAAPVAAQMDVTRGMSAGAADPLSVYTVNYPLAYFAERIGGEQVMVTLLAPADGDPAAWNPDATAMQAYRAADLVIANGAGYSGWIPQAGLPGDRLVDTSAGFSDRIIVAAEETHSHGLGEEHSHEATMAFTTWLDPQLAVAQAAAIRDALSARRPDAAADFDKQFAALRDDLEGLDQEFAGLFAALGDKPVLFSHPVYQYLERRYGINGNSVHWEPDVVPDDDELMALVNTLMKHPAELMVWEGEPEATSVDAIAAMGLESVTFSPCANRPANGDYLSVMRENVENLRAALAP
jgi:zinc transport system substrate-binding protein